MRNSKRPRRRKGKVMINGKMWHKAQDKITEQAEQITDFKTRYADMVVEKDAKIRQQAGQLAELETEHQKYRDTLYSAKMMDKDKEIDRLKEGIQKAIYDRVDSDRGFQLLLSENKRLKDAINNAVAKLMSHHTSRAGISVIAANLKLAAQPQKGNSDG